MATLETAEATGGDASGEAFAERLFAGVLGMVDVHMVYVGERLGLYRALAEAGDLTAAELAGRTGTHERYVREWLEQQAVADVLAVAHDHDDPARRRYHLPELIRTVLLDRDDLSYMAAFARMMVGLVRPLPDVLAAFRRGGGVPYAHYDVDFCEGQADMNRTMFVNLLGSEWLPAIADVDARLRADPPACVADVACGAGWSSIAIARAYPKVSVDGFDLDPHSIELAQANRAAARDVADRVSFELRDAADPAAEGRYDLVTVFEAVHDMGRPVEVLASVRRMLRAGGSVLIADERVAERFTAPGDELERLMYGYSVLHCLPVGMAEQPSAATGTAMRPDTLRAYAQQAGLHTFEVLPIENDFWRFYRLAP